MTIKRIYIWNMRDSPVAGGGSIAALSAASAAALIEMVC